MNAAATENEVRAFNRNRKSNPATIAYVLVPMRLVKSQQPMEQQASYSRWRLVLPIDLLQRHENSRSDDQHVDR